MTKRKRQARRSLVYLPMLLIVLVAIVTACAAPAAPVAPAEPTQAPTEAPPAATATPEPPPTPTPAPKMVSPLASASSCQECHGEIYDEWAQSYHSKTLTAMMGSFAKYIKYVQSEKGALTSADMMGCLGCHGPAMRFASEEEMLHLATLVVDGQKDAVSDIGVDCVSCHTLAASGEPWVHPEQPLTVYGPLRDAVEAKGGDGQLVHESVFSADMGKSEMCAACHTYITPDDIHVEGGTWDIVCSLTYDAWEVAAKGKATGNQCQDCHMPKRDGFAAQVSGVTMPARAVPSHTFPGWHSDAKLAGATDMSLAAKVEGGTLVVTVTIVSKVGHRMPDT
ncbi:MAG: hypothetical protein HUU23_16090 [Caldilineales bacterium]|nr:hypothetical protein [Caldilineales bacterium]